MINSYAIEIDNVCVDFRVPQRAGRLRVLRNLSLTVEDNEFHVILGPSGCGKTTLLRLIAGFTKPTSGSVLIHGTSPIEARTNKSFSMVFQAPLLFPWKTVRENVELPSIISGDEKVSASIDKMIKLVGLAGFENSLPKELSGGMQSRAAIARALTVDPDILLMDEPFGDLDELTRRKLNLELLKIWTQRKRTIVFVTHNLSEAVFLADRVSVMTKRPSNIKLTLPIGLDRPRNSVTEQDPAFVSCVAKLKNELGVDD